VLVLGGKAVNASELPLGGNAFSASVLVLPGKALNPSVLGLQAGFDSPSVEPRPAHPDAGVPLRPIGEGEGDAAGDIDRPAAARRAAK
jgi:hypothetical protein